MKKILLALSLTSIVTITTAMQRSNPLLKQVKKVGFQLPKPAEPKFHVTACCTRYSMPLEMLNKQLHANALLSLLSQLVHHPHSCPNLYIVSRSEPDDKQFVIKYPTQSLLISYHARRNKADVQDKTSLFQWIPENSNLGYSSKTFGQVSRITNQIFLPEEDKQQFCDIIHARESGTIYYVDGILSVTKE